VVPSQARSSLDDIERHNLRVSIHIMLASLKRFEEIVKLSLIKLSFDFLVFDCCQCQALHMLQGNGKVMIVPRVVDDAEDLVWDLKLGEDQKDLFGLCYLSIPNRCRPSDRRQRPGTGPSARFPREADGGRRTAG
jgi:hypothetical protein